MTGGSYFSSVGRVLLNGRRMLILAPWHVSQQVKILQLVTDVSIDPFRHVNLC